MIETAIFPWGRLRRPDDLPSKVTCSRAKDDQKVRLICDTGCKEYVTLKEVIDGTRTY